MNDLNLVIAGAAGEGIQTIGEIVARGLLEHGYAVFSYQEYESRIRGGRNSYRIRVNTAVKNAPRHRADLLLALNEDALAHYRPLLKEGGILLSEQESSNPLPQVSFTGIANEQFGSPLHTNVIAAGSLWAALGLPLVPLARALADVFSRKGQEVVLANQDAAEAGYAAMKASSEQIDPLRRLSDPSTRNGTHYYLSAHEALVLGAAHAGCRFISAYPMSPSTGIMTAFAKDSSLGVFIEQAEDEIAAINMALGASYAGARAMTATSGGGFALMVESISLAGMTETPLVIVLAQRPGPATGLPTRTAQEDLLFAVHAGHGEFPKLILAPADPQDAFKKTVRAFNLADKYQIPVILLTDQFLADARFSLEVFEWEAVRPLSTLAEPRKMTEYKRYQLTESGVSPRLYPGQSEHLVCADSDEHDERGHITEELSAVRPAMVSKRLVKFRELKKEINPPEEHLLEDAKAVFVGWGSTRGAIHEAVAALREDGASVGMIHFTEVWPLPVGYTFPSGKRYVLVEGNATEQLARLLRTEYDITFENRIQRSDGLPLTAEGIREAFGG